MGFLSRRMCIRVVDAYAIGDEQVKSSMPQVRFSFSLVYLTVRIALLFLSNLVVGSWDVAVRQKDYQVKPAIWRSAFFRVAKKLLSELEIVDEHNEDWASFLVWSNLYKITPFHGGNPGERMAQVQEPCL